MAETAPMMPLQTPTAFSGFSKDDYNICVYVQKDCKASTSSDYGLASGGDGWDGRQCLAVPGRPNFQSFKIKEGRLLMCSTFRDSELSCPYCNPGADPHLESTYMHRRLGTLRHKGLM